MADIIYKLEENTYMNITNKCPCRCTFCIRSQGNAVGDAENLWFYGNEPSLDEIKAAIDAYDFSDVKTVVFCGYGEPTERLDVLLETTAYLRSVKPDLHIRLNTNGLSDLLNKRPTAKEICELMDTVSISLNEYNSEKYEALCHPSFGEKAFPAILKFAEDCKACGVNLKFSVVDVISKEDIDACQALADKMGIPLRVRNYTAD